MINLKSLWATSDQPGSMGSDFRKARFFYFEKLLSKSFDPDKVIQILDIGGTQDFWKEQELLLSGRVQVLLLNLEKENITIPGIQSISGDATDLSQFGDNEFDLVFSNSVIEHLYTWKNQEKMAGEARRVGQHYFIQTPNKYFFLEVHYVLPFAQFYPKGLTYWMLTKTKLSRGEKWAENAARQYVEEIRLLSAKEMRKLFPGCTLYKEKFWGMNKSLIAHNLL